MIVFVTPGASSDRGRRGREGSGGSDSRFGGDGICLVIEENLTVLVERDLVKLVP